MAPRKPKKKSKPLDLDMLTDAQKRVVVAKDVLAALRARRYTATPGIYIDVKKEVYGTDDAAEVQHKLKTSRCRVCAVGAAAVACIARFDGADGNDFMMEAAKPLAARNGFTFAMLNSMEQAFEVHAQYYTGEGRKRLPATERFGLRYKKPADRLRAIFSNIVKHKGAFVP